MVFIVLVTILEIVLLWAYSIQLYDKGCRDTERAYKNKNCDKCVNYKTINCPNTIKCYSTLDKPYFKV